MSGGRKGGWKLGTELQNRLPPVIPFTVNGHCCMRMGMWRMEDSDKGPSMALMYVLVHNTLPGVPRSPLGLLALVSEAIYVILE